MKVAILQGKPFDFYDTRTHTRTHTRTDAMLQGRYLSGDVIFNTVYRHVGHQRKCIWSWAIVKKQIYLDTSSSSASAVTALMSANVRTKRDHSSCLGVARLCKEKEKRKKNHFISRHLFPYQQRIKITRTQNSIEENWKWGHNQKSQRLWKLRTCMPRQKQKWTCT